MAIRVGSPSVPAQISQPNQTASAATPAKDTAAANAGSSAYYQDQAQFSNPLDGAGKAIQQAVTIPASSVVGQVRDAWEQAKKLLGGLIPW